MIIIKLKYLNPSKIRLIQNILKVGSIHWDDINLEKTKPSAFAPYAQSKLANVLFTIELAERLKDTGVTVVSLHTGFVKTEIGRNQTGFWKFILTPIAFLFAKNATEGAQTTIHCAINPDVPKYTGRYFR